MQVELWELEFMVWMEKCINKDVKKKEKEKKGHFAYVNYRYYLVNTS